MRRSRNLKWSNSARSSSAPNATSATAPPARSPARASTPISRTSAPPSRSTPRNSLRISASPSSKTFSLTPPLRKSPAKGEISRASPEKTLQKCATIRLRSTACAPSPKPRAPETSSLPTSPETPSTSKPSPSAAAPTPFWRASATPVASWTPRCARHRSPTATASSHASVPTNRTARSFTSTRSSCPAASPPAWPCSTTGETTGKSPRSTKTNASTRRSTCVRSIPSAVHFSAAAPCAPISSRAKSRAFRPIPLRRRSRSPTGSTSSTRSGAGTARWPNCKLRPARPSSAPRPRPASSAASRSTPSGRSSTPTRPPARLASALPTPPWPTSRASKAAFPPRSPAVPAAR